MQKLLCPSMMCANFGSLNEEIKALEEAGADIFHIDFMDGKFVPNFGMGLQDFEYIRKSTTKTVDVHLMIESPAEYIAKFAAMGADIIYFHPEADHHPCRTLDMIHSFGKKAGIALNPGTSLDTIREMLYQVDYILVMTVNPGFAGQNYLSHVDLKIKTLLALKNQYHYTVMVDGAISPDKIQRLGAMGVEGFILGTSALFGKDADYKTIIQDIRRDQQ